MLSRSLRAVALSFGAVLVALPIDAQPRATGQTVPHAATVSVDSSTRMLVIAPHPDDEVLAAGGLLQHLRAAKGALRVVYLTDGEGYREGVQAEAQDHLIAPTVSDYRAYGHQREHEARAALRLLGFGAGSITFLGFPNGGLSRLMTTYWSEHRRAYRSPYTRLDRPSKSEVLVPDAEFRERICLRSLRRSSMTLRRP
jgi:LmbE family N-acetylglucosaminyl deacetylase